MIGTTSFIIDIKILKRKSIISKLIKTALGLKPTIYYIYSYSFFVAFLAYLLLW